MKNKGGEHRKCFTLFVNKSINTSITANHTKKELFHLDFSTLCINKTET